MDGRRSGLRDVQRLHGPSPHFPDRQALSETLSLSLVLSFFTVVRLTVTDLFMISYAKRLEVQREKHIEYLTKGLRQLGPSFVVLDANIQMVGMAVDLDRQETIYSLARCLIVPVSTYFSFGYYKSPPALFRPKERQTYKLEDSLIFSWMHDGGEVDVRACYTAISVSSSSPCPLSMLGHEHALCQTYEGGIAGEPGSEAHGGIGWYSDKERRVDFRGEQINWSMAATPFGRLHSVVDEQLMPSDAGEEDCSTDTRSSSTSVSCEGEQGHVDETFHLSEEGQQIACAPVNFFSIGLDFIREHAKLEPLFHSMALQQYILLCSQVEGGFRDKPGKHKDYYHTCYCLSGLSVCQYSWSKMADSQPLPGMVLGPQSNLLQPIHPLFNVVLERFYEAHEFFSRT
ncbi:prenyltransferase family protein [Actinidia rufa]|uniref:Prenyltransferase family protein n=1 Tax=Actinidia rufa TaxID=165716 RepID=A0A7J0DXZ0_9ERIC|nr:prenyltransferase family protein [Actinidia rufa]